MNICSWAGVLLAALFSACSGPQKEYLLKVKLLKLDTKHIYDKGLVYDVIFDSEEANPDSLKNKSRELFLKAIDTYKNKEQPGIAVDIFKASILAFPEAKTYYELGNALLDTEVLYNMQEAIEAYEVAEHLHFQPLSNVHYKKACAYNMLYNSPLADAKKKNSYYYRAIDHLRQAFNNGYFDTTALRNDPRINHLVSTKEYKRMVMEIMGQQESKPVNALFDMFRNSFPVSSGSLEIPLMKVDMQDYRESINYDYARFIPEMENVSFGRDVSHDFFYVARIAETSNYTALVYSSISFWEEEMQPVHTTLATYNNEGEIISKKLISCQCSAEKIKIATVEDRVITVQDYKRIWELPIDKVGFYDNKVKDHELIAEAKFRIDETGMIVDDNVPENYNDTTIVAQRY